MGAQMASDLRRPDLSVFAILDWDRFQPFLVAEGFLRVPYRESSFSTCFLWALMSWSFVWRVLSLAVWIACSFLAFWFLLAVTSLVVVPTMDLGEVVATV